MSKLTADEILQMFLALGTILAGARILGEAARKLNQPAVLGEILAGILLGPTVLGRIAPELTSWLMPKSGGAAIALDGLRNLAIALFLLVAGMEVDLSTIWRQGRAAILVGTVGIVFPFALGFATAEFAPALFGREPGQPAVFALFFATALSISALPVIARTLIDLHLYKSDFGMTVIAAAILNDLIGWIIFAVILGMLETGPAHGSGVGRTIALTIAFVVFVLTLGRWLVHRALPWVQAHTSWPAGVLGFALSLALFGAAFTEYVGIHAIFGAFLAGVALGDSTHLRERTRATIDDFVSSIFAPIFFGSIGLAVDFAANFELGLVLVVLVLACVAKVLGCSFGARLAGSPPREAWAMGFAMNARGSMEIILGTIALEAHLIRERMFVALVIMAVVTSMMSGPLIQRLLGTKRRRQFLDFLQSRNFRPRLSAKHSREAIEELCLSLYAVSDLDLPRASEAVWQREEIASTAIGHGVAVPHARLEGLREPMVALGLSREGIDFDALDGEAARIVFLILTPIEDDGAQIEILADIGRMVANEEVRARLAGVASYTELKALVQSAQAPHK